MTKIGGAVPAPVFLAQYAPESGKTAMEGRKMKSLRELYKIGNGPSSSHTMGPQKAAEQFCRHIPGGWPMRQSFSVSGPDGRGHRTDWILKKDAGAGGSARRNSF